MWLVAAVVIELAAVLSAYTQCYSAELGLDKEWKIDLTFEPLPEGWVGATYAMPGYYRARIAFDTTAMRQALDSLPDGTDVDAAIRRVVLHELWHVMLWEISELAAKANPYAHRLEEQLATRIERLPLWQDLCREE